MKIKTTIIYIVLAALTACSPKTGLMVTKDKDGSKMLIGTSNESSLMNDKAFAWFKEGYDKYQPDAKMVELIAKQTPALRIEAFGGTWCDDTHDLLPRFYKVMDAAHVPAAQITLHLTDRNKKTKDGSATRFHIANVPTFIIFKGEKEMGKIVESTKINIETDIAAILTDRN